MPEIRYNMLRKSQLEKFIGKAKINNYVFYLIKWKPQFNRQISWEPTSTMGNMGKTLVNFNDKIKNKILPYIQKQFQQKGTQLLQKIDEIEQQRKRSWKIQSIIGKRYLNGGIYYFMKWKDHSIFQSDWIAQHGLWRLYPHQFKNFKAKISLFDLPYLDSKSFEDFIDLQKSAFLNQPNLINFQQFIEKQKTKKEKLKKKKKKKEQQKVKSEFVPQTKLQIISECILNLRERFFRPIQTLYLKTQQYGVKTQENQYESTNDFLQSNFSFSETESNKLPLTQKNQTNIKFTNSNKDFNQQFSESDQELSKSFKNGINDIISQQNTRLKNRNNKQEQKNQTIQNEDSDKIQEQKQPKLEPSEPHQLLKASNLFSNKNKCLEFQQQFVLNEQIIDKSTFQHSATPKLVKFQFDGSLSKSFFVDDCQISKSCQLSISLSNINNLRHFQSKTLQQNFLTSREINEQSSEFQVKASNEQQAQVHKNIEMEQNDEVFNQQEFYNKKQKVNESRNSLQTKVRKITIKRKINTSLQKEKQQIPKKIESKEKIISIKLFAQDILSLQNAEKKQNLYEVIFQKSDKTNKSDLKQKTQEIHKERRFLETSYLKKYHNNEFLEYLEKEVVKLKKQH